PGAVGPEVETDGTLVAVEALEEERGIAFGIRRNPACGVAAVARVLDLDDVGAEVGQLHRRERACPVLLEGDNADVVERQSHPSPAALPRATTCSDIRRVASSIISPSNTTAPTLPWVASRYASRIRLARSNCSDEGAKTALQHSTWSG